jgi:hypothetical protein
VLGAVALIIRDSRKVDPSGLPPSRILLRTRAGDDGSALRVREATRRVMQCATRI